MWRIIPNPVTGKFSIAPEGVVATPIIPYNPYNPLNPLYPISPISPISPIIPYSPLSIRSITNPDDDPEMRKSVVRYYYDKIKDYYLPERFSVLLKYIIVENGKPRLVKSNSEYENNKVDKDIPLRVKFILDYYFGKSELELVIAKTVNKHGLRWYELKSKHLSTIKRAIFNKIEHILDRECEF